jgi:hypothetical protein
MWQMLASRRRAGGEGTSGGSGVNVEYERGDSQAQLPEESNSGEHDSRHGDNIGECVEDIEKAVESEKRAELIDEARKFWTQATEHRGVKVYQRNDIIDPLRIDPNGRTNIQRMKKGRAPIGLDGNPINLHHMLQSNDSAIAEVTQSFHQKNTKVIHINPNSFGSGIDRRAFDAWKSSYWRSRAKDFGP